MRDEPVIPDDRSSPFERLAVSVLRHRLLCAAFFVLATAGLLSGLPGLRIDNSLESLFPEGDDRLASLSAAVGEYGTETGVVIALRPPAVFENDFLGVLDRLTRRISKIEGVSRAVSLTNVGEIRAEGEEIRIGQLIPEIPVLPDELASIRNRALADPFVVGQILSADASTAAIAVQLANLQDDEVLAGTALDEIAALLDEEVSDPVEAHMSGIVVLFTAMNRYSVRDLLVFVPVGILVVTILLALVYRTFSGVLITLGATLLAVLWTFGLMGLCRVPITVGTTMLPVLILVISVSDAVHLISQYYEALAVGYRRRQAIEAALYKVGTPCLLTSLTTAIGFSSLLLSGLKPVRDLGLFAATGIFFAFLIFIFGVPVVLSCLEPPPNHVSGRLKEGFVTRMMAFVAAMTARHPRKILWTAGLVLVLGVSGIARIRVDTKFTEYFYPGDPIMKSIRFIDEHLTGIEPLRILLDTGVEEGVHDPGFLEKVDALEAFLRTRPEISRVAALPDLLKRAHRLLHGDDAGFEQVPGSREAVAQILLLLSAAGGDDLTGFLASPDRRSAQVFAMFRLVGTERQEEILREIEGYLDRHFDPGISWEMTDVAALNPALANNLVRSQVRTFSLALALIFAAMSILFRSLRMGILSMIPSLVPLALAAGLMGLSGITLNMVTVMVASIAIGIAVDDTIHILARYRIELRESEDGEIAMAMTLASSGRAVVFTSIVLVAGFAIPMLSQFRLSCNFAVLAATAMAGALLGDLFILPAILRLMENRENRGQTTI